MPASLDSVSALIVTWNSALTINACLDSLPPEVEVVVVDNHSSDDTVARIRNRRPDALLIESTENRGFGAACNLAAQAAGNSTYLLLNPDAVLGTEALTHLLAALEARADLGAVGPRILGTTGEIELSWGDAPSIRNERKRQAEQQARLPRPDLPAASVDLAWISGACMLLRAEAWQAVGGFDPRYFLYFEDLDLCQRLRQAGWAVAIEPAAEVAHVRGQSARQATESVEAWYRESQIRYYARHNSRLESALLRLYLLAKYLPAALRGKPLGRRILKLALGEPWSFR